MPGFRFLDDDLSDCKNCQCGGRPEMIVDFVDDFEVRCSKCHEMTHAYIDSKDAVKAWENGDTIGKVDLIIDDIAGALSGEIEYILFNNDNRDFWMVNEGSCDCGEILIKFKGRPDYYSIESFHECLEIGTVSSFNPSVYNRRLTPPEDIHVSLTSIRFNGRMPEALKFRYGDRYLFFFGYEDGWVIVSLSQYDIFEEDDTPIPDYDDSVLCFEIISPDEKN